MKPRSLPLALLTRYLAQEIFELYGSLGLFVAVLDDDGSIDRQAPVFRRADADPARAGHDDRAGGDFERFVAFAPVNFAARRVENRRRACQHHAGGQDRALSDERAFVDSAIASDQDFVFDDHGHCAYWFEHAADLGRRADVASLAYLGARPDQRM